MEKIRLNLGAGHRHFGNFINIDKYVTPAMIEELMIKGDITVFIHPQSEYVQADMMALPFSDNSVDYIECLDTMDHFGFREVGKVIGEMYRVLKPGAMARIQVLNFDGIAKVWTALLEQKTTELMVSADWLFCYFEMVQMIYGNQIAEGLYRKSAWCPSYATFMFMQEFKFSSINIITLPIGQGSKTPLEVAYIPTGRKVNMEEMVIEVVK